MEFREEFFIALNNWQRGWYEIQDDKSKLSIPLEEECKLLDPKYRSVGVPCFRKRFLHKGELVDIILKDEKNEGLASWTTDCGWAEGFKGIYKEGALTAAVFEHFPSENEVMVNLEKLWDCPEFVTKFESFKSSNPLNADAIAHFKATQKEVILNVPLRASELCRLSGKSGSFDDLCDEAGISEEERPAKYKQMVMEGVKIEEIRLLGKEGTWNVVDNIRQEYHQRHIVKPGSAG